MKTLLETWIRNKIGKKSGEALTLDALASYQLEKLRETISYAREKSLFYRRHLQQLASDALSDLDDLGQIPFTTAGHLQANPADFLCVPQGKIARVVTLNTSGTTGAPKRLFFTREDLELTVDFFCQGFSLMAAPGQNVLVLLPGDRPDSIGDLIIRGLERINVKGFVHGPVRGVDAAIHEIITRSIDCLVGIPTQVLALARNRKSAAIKSGQIKNVVLSADYVPGVIHQALERQWGCGVWHHYGMTEMGLGGGVDCAAFAGYHLREADIFFEIIDPVSQERLKDSGWGEVVFSTLTRKGMPLIRYRTGDIARFISEPCPCGSILRRMDHVQGRLSGQALLRCKKTISLPEIDEALFRLAWLLDFRVTLQNNENKDYLEVVIRGASMPQTWAWDVIEALKAIPVIGEGMGAGSLQIAPIRHDDPIWRNTGVGKRVLIDSRIAQ